MAKRKKAKLKVSELPSATVPSKCEVYAVLWENFNDGNRTSDQI